VVQAADPRKSDHLPELHRLDLARDGRFAVEAHVRAIFGMYLATVSLLTSWPSLASSAMRRRLHDGKCGAPHFPRYVKRTNMWRTGDRLGKSGPRRVTGPTP